MRIIFRSAELEQCFKVLYIGTASLDSVVKLCLTCEDFSPFITYTYLPNDQRIWICKIEIMTCVTNMYQ